MTILGAHERRRVVAWRSCATSWLWTWRRSRDTEIADTRPTGPSCARWDPCRRSLL